MILHWRNNGQVCSRKCKTQRFKDALRYKTCFQSKAINFKYLLCLPEGNQAKSQDNMICTKYNV